MDREEGARLFAWTAGPGLLTGAVLAVVVSVGASSDEPAGMPVILYVWTAVVGAVAGSLAGFVIGTPVAMFVGVLRRRTAHWRLLGAVLAGAFGIVAALAGFGGGQLVATIGVAAAVNAWWGLGRIFALPAAR
jgi:hypothetical protein